MKTNELRLQIETYIHDYLSMKGLSDRFSQEFTEKLANEFLEDIKQEEAGTRKPLFTGPKGLMKTVFSCTWRRLNNLFCEEYLQQILRSTAFDEYVISRSYNGDGKIIDADAARIDNSYFWFGEPASMLTNPADFALEEKELLHRFNSAHSSLLNKGRNGKLMYDCICFYRDGWHCGLKKGEEIFDLADALHLSRERASQIKCQAFKQLRQALDLDEDLKHLRQKQKAAKKFRKISNKNLLKSYYRADTSEPRYTTIKASIAEYSQEELDQILSRHEALNNPVQEQCRVYGFKAYCQRNSVDLPEAA